MPGKRIKFDHETLATLTSLASDMMMDFQELADEAFRDLLRKHNRPLDLKNALRQSAREAAEEGARADVADKPSRAVSRTPGKARGRNKINLKSRDKSLQRGAISKNRQRKTESNVG